MKPSYYQSLLKPFYEGKSFILSGAPLAAYGGFIDALKKMGAGRLFIIASGLGTGRVPSEEDAEWVVIENEARSMIGEVRQTVKVLTHLPDDVASRLDGWDPDRKAIALGNPFYTAPTLGGRSVFGYRRPEWQRLEDKILVDALWDSAGVARAQSTIVPAAGPTLLAASKDFDDGMGVVWAGDAKEGFNGGAEYVRWIRHGIGVDEASAFFGQHCDRVRVMPFLEGIPCSIHGMVFPTMTVAFRPNEMVTLRRPDRGELVYCGHSTFWDPPAEDRRYMRELAKKVGEYLRSAVTYRGVFTIDGVMTSEGFLPTELNTRAGSAMGNLFDGLDDVPWGLLARAVVEDEPHDYRPAEFEKLVLDHSDANRRGQGIRVVTNSVQETLKVELVGDPHDYRTADDGETKTATLGLGPGAMGGFVTFAPERSVMTVGESMARHVIAGLTVADDLWDTQIGELTAAASVR